MSRTPLLTPEEALKAKEDIWNGMSHKDISEKYGISYQIAVGIKAGRNYDYVPWPDGSTRGLSDMRAKELTSARRFGHATNKAQFYEEESDPYKVFIKSTGLTITREFYDEQQAKLRSIGSSLEIVFSKAAKALMRGLDEKRAEEHRQRMETHDERWAFYDALSDEEKIALKGSPPPRLPDDQCDPDANEKLDWDMIMLLGSKMDIVQIAEKDQGKTEPALKPAIQIAFKIFTQRQWKEDHVLKMIYLIKNKIERFWEANPDRAPIISEEVG